MLSAGYGGTICRFDGATGAVVQTYVDPEPGLGERSAARSASMAMSWWLGARGSAGARESMYVFDGTTGILLQTIRGPYYGTPYNAGFGTAVAAAGGVLVGSGWYSARFYDGMSYAFLGEVGPEDFRRDASRDTVTPVFGTSFAIWSDQGAAERRPRVREPAGSLRGPASPARRSNATTGTPRAATAARPRAGSSCVRRRSPWHVIRSIPRAPPVLLSARSTGSFGQRTATSSSGSGRAPPSLADFGDPTIPGSTYQLCFYDDLFVTPDLTTRPGDPLRSSV